MKRHIGGEDFQHGIDREQEADGIDAWRAREYDKARLYDMLRNPHLYDNDDVREWGAGISHTGEFGIGDR